MQFIPEGYILPILAFLVIAAVISWAVYWDYRKKQLQHEERRAMIEKGLTPPPPLGTGWPGVRQLELQLQHEERRLMIEKGMAPPVTQKHIMTAQEHLRRGTLMFALGVGMITAYLVVDFVDTEFQGFIGAAGLIVGLLGLGYLVYYLSMEKKTPAKGDH